MKNWQDKPSESSKYDSTHGQRGDETGDGDDSGNNPQVFDAEKLLPGAVLRVPNRHWGFEIVSGTDHPGACTHFQAGANDAILVKGTDAENVRNPRRYFFAEPSESNGLTKSTAFELVPRPFRLHRLKLLFSERYLGRLEDSVLEDLRAELVRLNPED